MGFIGVTFGMAAPLLTNSGATLSGLTDGQAVIGDTLRVISADATPSWRSPTSEPGDEIASGDTWSVAGTDGTPLYVVAGSDTLGPFTLRNRLDLAGWSLDLGPTLSLGKIVEFGATNAEIQLTIGGIDTTFSGTSYGIATGQGDEITIRQRNLLSNRLTLGTIAAAAPLVITAFPSVSGGQDIGDSLTIDGDEELSWDGVTVPATTQEARLVVDGTPRATGDLTLPAGSGGQNCEVQVRFGYDTAAGLSISTDWNTIPGESFTILDPPPPEPFDLTIEGLELVLSGGPSMTTLTVIAPPAYAGTYPIDPTDLTAGPMPLVAPQITGDGSPAIGEALTSTPGLWAYDGDLTEPTISYVWQRNATPIPGATGNSYVLQAGDEDTDITLRETATDTNGTRSIVSAVIRPEATGTAWGAPSLIAVGDGQANIQSGANRPTTPTIPTISDIGDGSVVLSGA